MGLVKSPPLMIFTRLLAAAMMGIACLTSCGVGKRDARVFELLPSSQTGVTFANTITTSDSLNVQTDVYIYNGAGVASATSTTTDCPTSSSPATWSRVACT